MQSVFGKNLKLLRKSKGLSQRKLAELVNVDQSTIVSYEKHGAYPTKGNTKNKLIEVLECSESDLFGYDKLGASSTKTDPLSVINNSFRIDSFSENNYNIPIYYETTLEEDIKKYNDPDYGRPKYYPVEPGIKELYPDAKMFLISTDTCNKVIPKGAYAMFTPLDFNRYDTKLCLIKWNNKFDIYRMRIMDEKTVALSSDSFTVDIKEFADLKDIEILGKIVWFSRNIDY